jgi:hypothetical protein
MTHLKKIPQSVKKLETLPMPPSDVTEKYELE